MKLGYLSFDRRGKFRLFALTDFSSIFFSLLLHSFFLPLLLKKTLDQMEIEKNEDQQLTTNTFMLLANSIRMNKHNEKKFITVRIDEKILSAVPQ